MPVHPKVSAPPATSGAPDSGAFDCLRLMAAAAVLLSHSWTLIGQEPNEPLIEATGGASVTIGTLAVYAFFAISGYLVTESWFRDPSPTRFIQRRALRIFPALILVIVGSTLILGPLVTDLNLSSYFEQKATWSYLSKILIFPDQHGLPGVFKSLPFPDIVNGSLWTLRLEFALYLITLVLGLLGALGLRATGFGLALLCMIATHVLNQENVTSQPFLTLAVKSAWYMVPFFIGMSLNRVSFETRGMRALALFLVLGDAGLLIFQNAYFHEVALIAVPFATILIATRTTCRFKAIGDYSYGLYLWGFPVQQAIMDLAPQTTVIGLMSIALPLTCLLAVVSWHTVEKRSLRLKPRRH